MTGRISALDGVRGLAAVAVVLGHARLVLLDHPVFALPGISALGDELGMVGNKAVWLFFVLSGFVLAGLMRGPSRTHYGAYLASRLARLYIPVAAAVAFSVVTMLAVPRGAVGFGGWIDAHPPALSWNGVVADLTLVAGTSGSLSPLWSLQWEVLFSLMLIVYVGIAERVPTWLGLGGSIALSAIGAAIGSSVLIYLPMFLIGVSLAQSWPRLVSSSMLARLTRTAAHRSLVAAVGVPIVVVLASTGAFFPPEARDHVSLRVLDTAASLVAAVLLIVLSARCVPLTRFFESRPLRWLGLISFSLYLVHEPILIAAVRLFGRTPVVVTVAVVLSFAAAAVFSWAVEQPAHRFAHRLRPRGAVTRRQSP